MYIVAQDEYLTA